jgi:hypothetical protein
MSRKILSFQADSSLANDLMELQRNWPWERSQNSRSAVIKWILNEFCRGRLIALDDKTYHDVDLYLKTTPKENCATLEEVINEAVKDWLRSRNVRV